MTADIIGTKPNAYVFTKSFAEQIILSESDKLPLSIVHPSISKLNSCQFYVNRYQFKMFPTKNNLQIICKVFIRTISYNDQFAC